jgi:hypothetical protein
MVLPIEMTSMDATGDERVMRTDHNDPISRIR